MSYQNFSNSLTDGQMTIEELNAIKFPTYIPAVIFTCVLIVVGLLGNTAAMIVFKTKAKPSNYKYFVLTLAFLDLGACTVAMPGVVADLSLPYVFPSGSLCKALRWGYFYIASGSTLTHVLMAVERYRKVCHPLKKQLSNFRARLLLGTIVFVLAPLGAAPAAVTFGHHTADTGVQNLTGSQCQVDDSMKETMYPTVYVTCLFICVLSCIGVISMCYIAIGRKIRSRNRFVHALNGKSSLHLKSFHDQRTNKADGSGKRSKSYSVTEDTDVPTEFGIQDTMATDNGNISKTMTVTQLTGRTRRKNRITAISLTITIVFAVSFCPYLALTIASYLKVDFVRNMTEGEEAVYMVAKQLFMIHNVVNPVVYFIMDTEFRLSCKAVLCRQST